MTSAALKIADVCEFYSTRGGGVKTYIDQKFAIAHTLGVDLVVIAPGPRTHMETRPGGRLYWVESPFERFDQHYHRFTDAAPVHALLHQEQPDVIEASSPWRAASIVAAFPRGLKALFMHMDPVAVYPETFLAPCLPFPWIDAISAPLWTRLRALSQMFDTTVVASHTVAARFSAHGLVRVATMPLGVDKTPFLNAQPDPTVRAEMLAACGCDANTPLLLAVSRHHPEKRLGWLMRRVIASPTPRALYVVGDGPWRTMLDRIARPPVYLAGRIQERDRLATMMASSDALLHGGAAETFGIAVAEALCAGLPVIIPDRGGAADFAGPHAQSYRMGDAKGCDDAVERMLAGLPQHRARARQAAHTVLTPADHLRQLAAHYRALRASPQS